MFYERYSNLEADIEKTLLRIFYDDGGGDEKEDEGEVEAGVTGACEESSAWSWNYKSIAH